MTMSNLEMAELELRRSRDRYEAERAKEEALKNGPQPLEQPQEPPALSETQRQVDWSKVTCIEDVVALASILGFRVIVDTNNPAFETVEHLVADDVNQETTKE